MITMEGLYYTEDHEWVKADDKIAQVGITDYAQNALGQIVYVELPEEEEYFSAGDVFAVIESVKAASDSFLPVSGKITEVNTELENAPQLLNENPYENWIVTIEMDDPEELYSLMNEEAYIKFCEEEE